MCDVAGTPQADKRRTVVTTTTGTGAVLVQWTAARCRDAGSSPAVTVATMTEFTSIRTAEVGDTVEICYQTSPSAKPRSIFADVDGRYSEDKLRFKTEGDRTLIAKRDGDLRDFDNSEVLGRFMCLKPA